MKNSALGDITLRCMLSLLSLLFPLPLAGPCTRGTPGGRTARPPYG